MQAALKSNGYRFSGLFEPLHVAVDSKEDRDLLQETLLEWQIRLRAVGDAGLSRLWSSTVSRTVGGDALPEAGVGTEEGSLVRLGREWRNELRHLGVERDDRQVFLWGESERSGYRVAGNSSTGQTVEVDHPRWTHDGVVVERGLARVKPEGS